MLLGAVAVGIAYRTRNDPALEGDERVLLAAEWVRRACSC